MNRIILIGNGFDLAHGLETGYKDFNLHYWKTLHEKLLDHRSMYSQRPFENELVSIVNDSCSHQQAIDFERHYFTPRVYSIANPTYKSELFKLTQKAFRTSRWVDIESIYHELLKSYLSVIYDSKLGTRLIDDAKAKVIKLNDHLKVIKNYLIDYLSDIQKEKSTDDIVNEQIKEKIFEPFTPRDISIGGEDYFYTFIKQRFDMATDNRIVNSLLDKYYPFLERQIERSDIRSHIEQKGMDAEKHEQWIRSSYRSAVPDYFLLPENILFLNFNYTKTTDLYLPKQSGFQLNHIHGELNNPDNPIIFGYGDEMDEHYKKIVNLNENEYLKNIKSIRYLETDNYRRLLTFIDSAPYQIYIMGHSCGNSDRTLLNTLFEHGNCVSIKPFFYQWEKKDDRNHTIKDEKGNVVYGDNYIDIVQNISRNFNDAKLMRDRVVNRTFCEPHPQNPRKN